ncbi:hypothetical protein [Shimia abyssi]|uniref:hypothetical protein n=1 Tax=Shimia abyssi TaxID=1662395 RepID=UPI001FB01D5E|nr:hypothetical protein [Shimia abyssi]
MGWLVPSNKLGRNKHPFNTLLRSAPDLQARSITSDKNFDCITGSVSWSVCGLLNELSFLD